MNCDERCDGNNVNQTSEESGDQIGDKGVINNTESDWLIKQSDEGDAEEKVVAKGIRKRRLEDDEDSEDRKRVKLEIIFDVETEGFDFNRHHMINIGTYVRNDGTKFESFINIGRKISQDITDLTGILNEQLEASPKFQFVFEDWKKFTMDAKTRNGASEIHLVCSSFFFFFLKKVFFCPTRKTNNQIGYNIDFDIRFLTSDLKRIQKDLQEEFNNIGITKIIDPKKYAEGVKKYPHKLLQTECNNVCFKQASVYEALYGTSKKKNKTEK